MQFPLLSLIIFLPLIAGIIILFLPQNQEKLPRQIALAASGVTMILSFIAYFGYDTARAGYQFVEQMEWVPAFGISYALGVDGLSVPLVLLAGIVLFCGVIVSWKIDDRPREFFAYILILGTSVLGVFSTLDLFQLFFFMEIAIFPKYLMIVMWGSPKTREYGGMKLTLYLFIGSVLAMLGSLAIYYGAGQHTFSLLALEGTKFAPEFQIFWFPFVFVGFAIMGGMFPFHSWAPDGHVAAPTAISMMLAGVEMKVGVYAALRVAILLMPDGARYWAPAILILATINVVYGAFIALIQTDFKYVIGFSSVSHMGLVLIGMATFTKEGLLGSGLQMFSHGVMTALFFSVVGMVYDRTHNRDISKLGGLARKMPLAAIGFIIGGLVSMGMPGFSGFVAEFPIFVGAWKTYPIVAIIAVLGIILTAAYILLVTRKVFFGELPAEYETTVGDVSILDKTAIVLLSVIMVVIGWFPGVIVPVVESAVVNILGILGGL